MLRAVDLFSGAGGLSLGLRRAGFKVIGAVEADPLAAATYKANHKGAYVFERDINTLTPETLKRRLKLKKGDLDLLAGCPPCQSFSRLKTKNGGKTVRDKHTKDLVLVFLEFVRTLLPKAVMMENVPGLAKDKRTKAFVRVLKELGYNVHYSVLNASDYGVPQRRKRMILIGCRLADVTLAEPSEKYRSVRDAIGKLEHPRKSGDPLHNYTVARAEHVADIIRLIPQDGGSRGDLPKAHHLECHKNTRGFHDVYGRMRWADPSPTITGGCINPSKGRFLHPRQNRAITLREAALLQGFPKSYRFSMAQGRYPAAQMIGNAFPPAFAYPHAKKIKSALTTQQGK